MASIGRNGRGQITDREIERLTLPEGKAQEDYWHPDLAGFGVRVGKRGAVYVAKGSVDVGGRKRPRRITIGRTDLIGLVDAMARGRELLGMMATGVDPNAAAEEEAGRISTLADLLDRARAGKGDGYARNVEQYMPGLLEKKLTDIDAGRIEARYREIIAEVAARGHGPSARSEAPGVATANAVLRGLSAAWNYVETLEGDRHGIPANPVGRLAKVKAVRKTPVKHDRIPSAALGRFWTELSEEKFIVGRDAIAVMLLTGLRRQSVCAMRVEEWDADRRVLTFAAGRLKGKGRAVTVPVSEEVAAILDRRTAVAGRKGWMFPGSGKDGYLAEPRSVLDRMMKVVGGVCNVHGLRRTFSSEAAFVMGEVQRKSLMVHAMSGVTQEVYTEIAAEDLRGSAQAVTDRLLGYCDDAKVIDRLLAGVTSDGVDLSELKARALDEVKATGLRQAAADAPGYEALTRAEGR